MSTGSGKYTVANQPYDFQNPVPSVQHSASSVVPVPYAGNSILQNATIPFEANVSVIVTFDLSNQSRLGMLLANLSNPSNPQYHKFITRSQFAAEFGAPVQLYLSAARYFGTYGNVTVTLYQDRVSIGISGPSWAVGSLLNTEFVSDHHGGSVYYASRPPSLPADIGMRVSEVAGLSNAPAFSLLQSGAALLGAGRADAVAAGTNGYPQPISSGGVQYIYGADLQVSYQEQSLLSSSYPTGQVIATILWSGQNSSGTNVGPFVPSDIYHYYNTTLPSGEPHSTVHGVPINGAPPPGPSSSYDVTGANYENTLDLEMVGSTAPGSSIYNVYGASATTAGVDDAFAFILNPNSTYQALNNVSVVSNSFGAGEFNDTTWYTYLQEAQARGISVLASSGDSGDNSLNIPASMSYSDFGATAVGGTTLVLNSNTASSSYLGIASQIAWYESSSYTGGAVSGSTGGISTVFAEPAWQTVTEANNVILGSGRGVPDIAAIANNTIVELTVNGTSNLYAFGGTSVACPVEAGMVAELDNLLAVNGQGPLGYLNPVLYGLGNKQFSGLLQSTPYYDVISGANSNYNALAGYDLVTGWGSLNALNFSSYVVSPQKQYSLIFSETGLTAGTWFVNTSSAHESAPAGSQITYLLPNGTYNFTVSTSYPVYAPSFYSFILNVSGSGITYPQIQFNAVESLLVMNETGLPAGIEWYLNATGSAGQALSGHSANSTISLHATNGTYTYSVASSDKTYAPSRYAGSIAVKSPSDLYLPSSSFSVVNEQIIFTETGLAAGEWYVNISGQSISAKVGAPAGEPIIFMLHNGTYTYRVTTTDTTYHPAFYTAPLSVQGNSSVPVSFSRTVYRVSFSESGLPAGTKWSVRMSGSTETTTSSILFFNETNGTYTFTILGSGGYAANPPSGNLTVQGAQAASNVSFKQSGTGLNLPTMLNSVNLIDAAIIAVFAAGAAIAFTIRSRRNKL